MRLDRQRYDRKLLVSYLPIFLSVFMALVLFILLGSMYLSRETIKRESIVMAKFVNTALDRELKLLEDVLHTELLDKSRFIVLTRLNPTHNSYYSTYELSVMLREFRIDYPLIDSIYIYRFSDQSVQSMNVTSTLERFGDREFIRAALKEEHIDRTSWTGIREYREFDGQAPEKVITLTRSIPVMREPGGLIVINVRQSDLLKLAQRLSDPQSTAVTIEDAAGQPVVTSGPEHVRIDASDTSAYSGYTVRLGYRESVVSGILNTLIVVFIAIASTLLAIGTLGMIHATRKISRPVQAVVSKLERLVADAKLPHGAKSGGDEFGFLEQVLEKMIRHAAEFEQRHKELAVVKRRVLFAELREGGFTGTQQEAHAQMAANGWNSGAGGYLMAVAELDRYDRFTKRYTEYDQSLLKFALFNVLAESGAKLPGAQPWVDWAAPHQVAMLFPIRSRSAPEDIRYALNEAADWIERHLKLTVTIAVGSVAEEAKSIHQSYEEARHVLRCKHALGAGRVIGPEELETFDRTEPMGLIGKARDVAESFRLAAPGWKDAMDCWFAEVGRLKAPEDRIDLLLQCLLYHIRREVELLSGEFEHVWNEEFALEAERCLSGAGLAVERGEALREVIGKAGGRFASIREEAGHAAVMGDVRDYIDRHFADPNLSLASLGDRFGMNSKTLSRLFKEHFGENFVDYLMRRRIAEAKQLLMETDAPIQVISREVGYENALSFTRAFKRMEGVTPLSLRKA